MISRMMASLTVFIILIIAVMVTGREYDDTRDAEIDELLKKLNKPALKSIKVNTICDFKQLIGNYFFLHFIIIIMIC